MANWRHEHTGLVEASMARRTQFARFIEHRIVPPIDAVRSKLMQVADDEMKRLAKEAMQAELQRLAKRRAAQVAAMAEEYPEPNRIHIRAIQNAVCEASGYNIDELIGARRAARIARARHTAIGLVKQMRPDLSLPSIAKAFGNRDHTTIMHALKMFEQRRGESPTREWLEHPAVKALL